MLVSKVRIILRKGPSQAVKDLGAAMEREYGIEPSRTEKDAQMVTTPRTTTRRAGFGLFERRRRRTRRKTVRGACRAVQQEPARLRHGGLFLFQDCPGCHGRLTGVLVGAAADRRVPDERLAEFADHIVQRPGLRQPYGKGAERSAVKYSGPKQDWAVILSAAYSSKRLVPLRPASGSSSVRGSTEAMIHSVSDLIAIVRKVAKSEDFRAIVRFAEGAGKVIAVGTVVLTAWLWIRSIPERTRTAHYAAWQVIAQAQSQTGNAGRVDALQSLAADHVPLDGVDVHGAFLYDLHLNGAALRGATFSGTHLREPVFDNADISDADFRQVTVVRSTVRHRIAESSFHNAKISGTRFDGSKLITADLSTEHHRHSQYEAGDDGEKDYHTSFAGADSYGANFNGREMDWAEFAGASLLDSDFTNTAFWDSDFREAALSGSTFERALLLYVDFTGSCLNGVSFKEATLVGVNFSNALFDRGTNFRGALIDPAERNKILVSLAHAQNAALAIYDPSVKKDLDHVIANRSLPAITPYDEHPTKMTTQAVRMIVQPSGVRDSITPGLGILDARARPDLFPAHVPSRIVCLSDSWDPNGRSSFP